MKSSTETAHCHTYAGGQPITPAEHAGQTGEFSTPIAKNTGKHFSEPCTVLREAGGLYAVIFQGERLLATNEQRHAQLEAAKLNDFYRRTAAPDLLEALETIATTPLNVEGYNSLDAVRLRFVSMQSTARAAIAKARPHP